jgi:hypothetical protein
MFIAALFTIAKLWKQPRCYPTTGEWIKKINIHTLKFYSAIRKKETIWFEGKWMNLKDIMLSEISKIQKDKSHVFLLICGRQTQKIKYIHENKHNHIHIYM